MKLRRKLQSIRHTFRSSRVARAGLVNGTFGVADYIAQPLGMLIAAPLLIRSLGISQYGVWMVASAMVGAGNILASGFGDAAVKHLSECRGRNDREGMGQVMGSVLTINLLLGSLMACLLWVLAPSAVHIMKIDAGMRSVAVKAFRIGAALLVMRSMESVFVGVLRAFENYRPAVQITSVIRLMTIAAAVILAMNTRSILAIMMATLCLSGCGVALLAFSIHVNIGSVPLLPSWNTGTVRSVMSFACFSSVQGLSGMAFNQADRLIIGALLGPMEVGYYSVCAQATQPIHGIVASGLHFLFPHLSARSNSTARGDFRRIVVSALWCNVAVVTLLSLPLVLFSKALLTAWMGSSFAGHTFFLLSLLALASGFLALNVTPHYALLALGHVRYVTVLNLVAGVVMLLAMALLVPRFGLAGAAFGRLVYGPITWLMYVKLNSLLRNRNCDHLPSVQGLIAPAGGN